MVVLPPETTMFAWELREPMSMLRAVTVPLEMFKPSELDNVWRPMVTAPRLTTAPELIFNSELPSLLLLSATFVKLFVITPPPFTFAVALRLDMVRVLLVITPPELMLMTSAESSTIVVVPTTLNPAAEIVSVGTLLPEPSVSDAMLAAVIGEA